MAYPDPTLSASALAAAPAAAAALRAEQSLDRLRASLMRQSLSRLLDGAAGARQALPHLAALEVALAEHGTALLAGLSRPVLIKVCGQLAGLPLPLDDAPLLDLQEHLLFALETAPAANAGAQRPARLYELSDFLTEEKLLVAEASYDDFAAVAASFATTLRSSL